MTPLTLPRNSLSPARTLVLAALILVLAAGLAETIVRLGPVQRRLPAPSLGSGHQNFDLKIALLDAFVKKEGGLDCLFIGPSTVNYGINPAVVRATFRRYTGHDLRCFNFGLAALSNPTTRLLMRLLVDRYHPRNIILGCFTGQDRFGVSTEERLAANPWVNYVLGRRTFRGWLTEHSVAFRYFLRLTIWLKQPDFSASVSALERQTAPDGYSGTLRIMPNIDRRPDPVKERENYVRFGHFSISPEHLRALEDLLRFKSRVGLAVVEMPIHPTYLDFFGNGKADFDRVTEETRARAESRGVPYWSPDELRFPSRAWWNRIHLNSNGADILSRWLGRKLAAGMRGGRIENREKVL